MKKILVMGGSYFIGKSIVERLLKSGEEVTVLNRGSRKAPSSTHQLICDRNDREQMRRVLQGHTFDAVIDVCGLNRTQMEILCESLDPSNLSHFVFVSSSAVYAADKLSIPFSETDLLGENFYWKKYGSNKIEAETYLTSRFSRTDTALFLLRPPYVYGENNYAQRESFVFEHILTDRPLLVPASNPRLQFLYAPDLSEIVEALLTSSLHGVNIFNVGNSTAPTAKEWVECCCSACGKSAEIILYDYRKDGRFVRDFFPFYDYSNVLDVTKIKSIVPWETEFVTGLKRSYAWYLQNRDSLVFHETIRKNEEEILRTISR